MEDFSSSKSLMRLKNLPAQDCRQSAAMLVRCAVEIHSSNTVRPHCLFARALPTATYARLTAPALSSFFCHLCKFKPFAISHTHNTISGMPADARRKGVINLESAGLR